MRSASDLPGYQDPRRRVRNIQWLRAFAAVAVLLFHASIYPALRRNDSTFVAVFDGRFGLLGVSIFFVISGTLMAEIIKTTDPWTFLVHRITRIYPIFLLVLLAFFLARYHHYRINPPALTLVPIGLGYNYNLGVEWTLLFETTFYVFLFFCSLAGLAKRIELVALVWLALIALGAFFVKPDNTVLMPTVDKLPFMAVNAGFAGGLLIPWLAKRNVFQPALVSLALACAILSDKTALGGSRWLASVAAVILVGLAVSWSASGRSEVTSRIGTIADRFGDWSYALYLCHVPVIIWILQRYPTMPIAASWLLTIVLAFAVAVPFGMLDIALYRRLRRAVDRSPIMIRKGIALVYVAAFLIIAGTALFTAKMAG